MSNEQNATPGRPSLLDRIHLFREFAKRAGWSDLAEWLTKHADEPCPAAIAQFMEMGAEVSEPRKCVQSVNVYGLPLCHPSAGCGGDEYHIDFDPERHLCVMSAHSLCPHHCAIYNTDPPASEPSRTEAVKEAKSKLPMHERCVKEHECWWCQHVKPILSALADAERKLADKTSANAIMSGAINGLHEILAAAEKRAKDADTQARHFADQMRTDGDRIATLARKLATAREKFVRIESIDCAHGGCESCRSFVRDEARSGLAAIDAPAGEAAPIPLGGKCRECGGVTYGTREVHLSDCSLWMQPVPPEPANAQESEAASNLPASQMTEDSDCPYHVRLHPDEKCTCPPKLSAPRFTAEEARHKAQEVERDYPKTAATLRYYADLLERDDALERAAQDVLAVLARMYAQPDGSNLVPLFEAEKNLRSVLAQRAKGKA